MGNYSGTTRCGNCYEEGHNKAGCPRLKERIERLRKDDPSHYLVRREDEKAAARTARATGKRICAYCKTHRKIIESWDWRNMEASEQQSSDCIEANTKDSWGDDSLCGVERDTLYGTEDERGVGHSVRACKYRKADVARRTSDIAARRVVHLDRMLSNGIGPGASVVFSDDCASQGQWPTPGTFVVRAVNWPYLGIEVGDDHAVANRLESLEVLDTVHVAHLFNPNPPYGMEKKVTLPLDTLNLPEDNNRYRSSYTDRAATLHRPTSAEKVRNSIPFGWTDGLDERTQEIVMDGLMRDVKTRAKKK